MSSLRFRALAVGQKRQLSPGGVPAWRGSVASLPSSPCGNFSDTSRPKIAALKGSIGHSFKVCIRAENQNQRSFYPFVLQQISVLFELRLGHLCYCLRDVPPQPNSPRDNVSKKGWPRQSLRGPFGLLTAPRSERGHALLRRRRDILAAERGAH